MRDPQSLASVDDDASSFQGSGASVQASTPNQHTEQHEEPMSRPPRKFPHNP